MSPASCMSTSNTFRTLSVNDGIHLPGNEWRMRRPAAISLRPADFALHLITATTHPAAPHESSAQRASAQPAPNDVNQARTLVTAG